MKYFFTFKTKTQSEKFDGKELFYMRLLNKRMGRSYILHKNKCEYSRYFISSYVNHFDGYVIEFNDYQAFSKFKLGYNKLFNPNLNPKDYITSTLSFYINDETFIDDIRKKREECIALERHVSYELYSYNRDVNNFNTFIKSITGNNSLMAPYAKFNSTEELELVEKNKDILRKISHSLSGIQLKSLPLENVEDRKVMEYNSLFNNLQEH